MRRPAEFSAVLRGGARARRGSVVVHQLSGPRVGPESTSAQPPVIGLVVARAVGPSVIRHRVSRRLRAQLTARLGRLQPNSRTVVRALPESALVDSATLGMDLDAALAALQRKSARR